MGYRDTRGIHDLMYLYLLPKLNIYRPDLMPSDLSTSQFPALNVAAVLLTHADLDHCGNIGMLKKDIPLVASPESLVIMKGMQDTGVSSLETDAAYFSPRQPTDDLGLYLSSIAGMSGFLSLPQARPGWQEGQEAGAREMLLLRQLCLSL
ncbi:Uncharacterised protein [uncultured archaeon]|nr:Uncharacterised protein [uncultured archaeon]